MKQSQLMILSLFAVLFTDVAENPSDLVCMPDGNSIVIDFGFQSSFVLPVQFDEKVKRQLSVVCVIDTGLSEDVEIHMGIQPA